MKNFIKKFSAKIKYGFEYFLNVDWFSKAWLGRIPISLRGKKWTMHITDEDPNPSVPHLHGVEDNRYTMNVYTGEVFWDRKPAGILKMDEYQKLWNDDKFLDMVAEARKYYLQHHPKAKLPDCPNFAKQESLSKVILQTELTPSGLNLTAINLKKNPKKR